MEEIERERGSGREREGEGIPAYAASERFSGGKDAQVPDGRSSEFRPYGESAQIATSGADARFQKVDEIDRPMGEVQDP